MAIFQWRYQQHWCSVLLCLCLILLVKSHDEEDLSNFTSLISLFSTMSFSPTPSSTPTHVTPAESITVVVPNCFFLEATEMNFTIFNGNYQNVSLLNLSTMFPTFSDTIEGCNDTHKQLHNFTRVYKDNSHIAFWFTMQFTYDNMEDSWSLSVLKFGNVTNNQVHIFDYANCGGVIEVPDDVSYFCSQVECHGHESVQNHIRSRLKIVNFRVDAFLKKGSDPAPVMNVCGSSSPSNKIAFIITGLVVGITLVLVIIIIIVSFIYKRLKYGQYNLLD